MEEKNVIDELINEDPMPYAIAVLQNTLITFNNIAAPSTGQIDNIIKAFNKLVEATQKQSETMNAISQNKDLVENIANLTKKQEDLSDIFKNTFNIFSDQMQRLETVLIKAGDSGALTQQKKDDKATTEKPSKNVSAEIPTIIYILLIFNLILTIFVGFFK